MSVEQFSIRPIHVPMRVACQIVGECRSSLYEAIKRGELTAIKAGSRTVLLYDELEQRCAARPVGLRKMHPTSAAARDAAIARRKTQARHKRKG